MRTPEYYAGRPISSLQTMLRLISETDTGVLPVIPDGKYGENTYASVLSFQDVSSLPLTGEVDVLTWNKIVHAYDRALPQTTSPSIAPLWPIYYTVRPGQFDRHIYLIQAMLIALVESFPQYEAPEVNGTLDDTTQQGLRWVQKAAGLSQTGALDTATWNYLNALYRTMVTGEETTKGQ